MATSALSYASRLCRNDNKGPLGTDQLFDRPSDVNSKLIKLYEYLCTSKSTVVHTGAGVSTGAGIPDFRGPTGVWTIMKRQSKKRKRMTDGNCIITNSENNTVIYGKKRKNAVEFVLALPSEAHLAIVELLNHGIVKNVITQNIDGLHALSGIKFSKLTELHGNVFVERCLNCGRRYKRPYVMPTISFNTTGNLCGICTFPPSGILTDVVLDWFDKYEDHYENRAIKISKCSDFHLTLGTSLHIEPACHYVSSDHYRHIESPLVIVNYQKTKLDIEADEIIHCDVNKLLMNLIKKFRIKLPNYMRKVIMTVIKYNENGKCILLIRLPCIIKLKINNNHVIHECLCIQKGIHKFIFLESFTINLLLWFNTNIIIYIPYENITLFKGEVWELIIAATDGKSNKNIPKIIKCNNNNNIINIIEMTLIHNSNLINEQTCKLIAFLDLLEYKSLNFYKFKLNNSLILLSYLWSIPIIKNLLKIKKEHNFNINFKSSIIKSINNITHYVTTSAPHEVQSNSSSLAVPPEVTTTVPTAVEASSNYLSLKGVATPGDRGGREGSDGSSIMGMMEDGAKDVLDVTSSGKPAADLREAEGEVNRRADGRTRRGGDEGSDGSSIMGMMEDGAKDMLDVTSSGLPVADLREAEGEVNKRAHGRNVTSSGIPETIYGSRGELKGRAVCKTTSGGDVRTTSCVIQDNGSIFDGSRLQHNDNSLDINLCDNWSSCANTSSKSACNGYSIYGSMSGGYMNNSIDGITDDREDTLTAADNNNVTNCEIRIKEENNVQGTKLRDIKPFELLCKASTVLNFILNKALNDGIITTKNDQIIPNLSKLHVDTFMCALNKAAELKLFINNDYIMGEMVNSVPNDVKLALPRRGKSLVKCKLSGNVNAFEVLVHQILVNNLEGNNINLYLLQQFYQQMPLWILSYIADLFECV